MSCRSALIFYQRTSVNVYDPDIFKCSGHGLEIRQRDFASITYLIIAKSFAGRRQRSSSHYPGRNHFFSMGNLRNCDLTRVFGN